MRTRVLILAVLGVFVVVPGAILAFHDPPSPHHTPAPHPATRQADLQYIAADAAEQLVGSGLHNVRCSISQGVITCTADDAVIGVGISDTGHADTLVVTDGVFALAP